jgi:cytochrome b pre-mRNA-processing protein 3
MISLFRRNPQQRAAELAYGRVVDQARQPGFFGEIGVPDTIDGRFELICLHAFLFLHRLKGESPAAAQFGQRFVNAMFADFDRSLREMGTGDLSVGRQVKRMAQALYGRIEAYENGLAGSDAMLKAALARNLFGTVQPAQPALDAMAGYVRGQARRLGQEPAARLLAGEVSFGGPPTAGREPQQASLS